MSFNTVTEFEQKVSEFFGSSYAVAVLHAWNSRYKEYSKITVPTRTYISVPFLANKLSIDLEWSDKEWKDYYYLGENVIDAAVLWKQILIFLELICV